MPLVSEWRKNLVQKMVFPSGNVALVRRAGVMELVEQGLIPDTLSGLVAEFMDTKAVKPALDDLQMFADVVNLVAKACFVDPPVADEGSEVVLAVNEIPFADRAVLFAWANEAADKLRPFCAEAE